MNIVDPILAQSRYQPHAVALCVPGERHAVINYAQVAALIHNIARHSIEAGLKPGDIAVTFVDDAIMHALLILGLTKAGVVTISGRNPDLPGEIKIDAILSEQGRTFSGSHRVITVDSSWMKGDGMPVADIRPRSHGDEVCRIIFTSGTTGDAKGVAYTHRMVTERAVRFDYLAGSLLGGSLRTYIDLGFATSLGYLFLIRTLTRGGMLVMPGSSQEYAQNACDLYQVQSWIGAPGGLLQLVDYFEQSGGRRCNYTGMLAGGSFLSKALSERVRARVCSNVIAAYGSTETNMVATAPAYVTAQTEGAVGYLTPGMIVGGIKNNWGAGYASGSASGLLNPNSFVSNNVKVGWTAGIGIEHMFAGAPHWSFRAEALWVQFGNQTVVNPGPSTFNGDVKPFNTQFQNEAVLARLGVNYRF